MDIYIYNISQLDTYMPRLHRVIRRHMIPLKVWFNAFFYYENFKPPLLSWFKAKTHVFFLVANPIFLANIPMESSCDE